MPLDQASGRAELIFSALSDADRLLVESYIFDISGIPPPPSWTAAAQLPATPLAQMTAERDALLTQVTTLQNQKAELATQVTELSQRPTLAEVQDARIGSVVLIKDEAGEINFDFKLEETEDLANWTPVAGGTWTNPGDGGVEVDLPLAPNKRFYRVVVEFEFE